MDATALIRRRRNPGLHPWIGIPSRESACRIFHCECRISTAMVIPESFELQATSDVQIFREPPSRLRVPYQSDRGRSPSASCLRHDRPFLWSGIFTRGMPNFRTMAFKRRGGFGPQSARAGGEVIHVDPIDHYSGVVSTGRRGLGIFPLARVSASEALNRPGVSQWKEYRSEEHTSEL